MKKCIAELPIVTTPNPKEELLMYLCAAREAVRAILLTERDSRQVPVYFVSRALENPRNQLQLNGKTGFIVGAPHEEAEEILSSTPDGVDFITKKLDKEGPSMEVQAEEVILEPWTLFTNRSSCLEGSGARLILTRPEGEELTYAVRFEFDASNNEAEYEALVAGLWIAEQIGVKNLIAKVPRSENKKEDALSKITSTIVEEKGHCWVTPLIEYLVKGNLPAEAKKLNIKQRFASVKHPQTNGQVERANHSLGEGIKAILGKDNRNRLEKVPHVLWAHRIMIKISNEDTLFSRTYGTEAVIPVEIGMPSLRCEEVKQAKNNEGLLSNLDILEERREKAAIREARNKGKMEKYYNAKFRSTSFRPGDFVYRNNEASHAKKVESWAQSLPRTWNVQDLKKCYL
uniref:Reverse transcriptase domain-containing protein n=1 Tax=Tanacetum cinerariifolium TaxID=118510 RepID=A0A6L2NLJ7_TANCI|nr:reverse transcriptase domain-containing protein [Tanacetum cinerariifolium]